MRLVVAHATLPRKVAMVKGDCRRLSILLPSRRWYCGMAKLRAAFIGFRHGHIWDSYDRVKSNPEVEIVACCEEDPETREAVTREGKAFITHEGYRALLDSVECDFVVVGDYYGKRGSIVADSLAHDRHVFADKPLCTRLAELRTISELATRNRLQLGMMLDLRDSGIFIGIRDLVRNGEIGVVQAIALGGQHPLRLETRPQWYHEKGKHGGTINDIGIHGIDAISWITGLEFASVVAARSWKANLPESSCLQNAAQFLLTMENQCGVVGDVSYLAPDDIGYTLPQYWRMTLWGSRGVIESSITAAGISRYQNGARSAPLVPPGESRPGGCLAAFLAAVRGAPVPGALTTEEVIRSTYVALKTQEAADRLLTNVAL